MTNALFGVTLLVAIVVLLATVVGAMVLGFGDRLDDDAVMLNDQACPGFQEVEVNSGGDDFDEFLQELQDDNCALWLPAGEVQQDGGRVSQWRDNGSNEFHATQSNATHRPELVYDGAIDPDVLSFDASHGADDDFGEDPNSGVTDGEYLRLDRDVEGFGVDEDSGIVIVAVVKPA